MLFPVKSTDEYMLTDEALEALMQEEWLDAMGELKKEYQNIPVPVQAQNAVQQGIQRAKNEAVQSNVQPKKIKHRGRFWGGMAALTTAAAAMLLFVTLNHNPQLAVAAAEIPALKPVVELITGQEYHEDVYMDIKVAHLAGRVGEDAQGHMPLPLSALFAENADYVTLISNEIKYQMEQSDVYASIREIFAQIAPDQKYYLNAENQLVIVLDGYDTAPEFIINTETIAAILK